MRKIVLNVSLVIACLGTPIAGWIWFQHSIARWFPAMQDRGLYGDQFGALNTLFSGLAFGGVILTLYLTYHQVRLQHRELESRTDILQRGQQELAQQTRSLADQLTEITGRVHPMVDALAFDGIAQKVFEHAREALQNEIQRECDDPKRQERLQVAFDAFVPEAERYIEVYLNMFNSLYHNPDATHATAGTIRSTARVTEEIAREMGSWAKNIRENRELNDR